MKMIITIDAINASIPVIMLIQALFTETKLINVKQSTNAKNTDNKKAGDY